MNSCGWFQIEHFIDGICGESIYWRVHLVQEQEEKYPPQLHISTGLPTLNPIPANSPVTLPQGGTWNEKEKSSSVVAGVINITLPRSSPVQSAEHNSSASSFARSEWMNGWQEWTSQKLLLFGCNAVCTAVSSFSRHTRPVHCSASIYLVGIRPSLYRQFGCYSMWSETADWLVHQIQSS